MNESAYPTPRNMDHLMEVLSSFTNYEKNADFHKGRVRFDLGNMRSLCEAAGNPHKKVPCLHVTGSKGKGSTALMITAVLRFLGARTGTFTSPHLERINERIAVDGEPLSDSEFLASADQVLALFRETPSRRSTFFEFITLAAMKAFLARDVEAAIYEVGLGGRLDATNVVLPEVSVITSIELEHCAVLGSSEEEIAEEKCGIIKKGKPVISAVPEGSRARRVIEERTAAADAPLIAPGRGLELALEGDRIRVEVQGRSMGPFTPPRPRKLQSWNAACALAAAHLFAERRGIDWNMESALEALDRLCLPGRFEMTGGRPPVIVDGAHTPASIRATVEEAHALCPKGLVTVLGLAEDKDAKRVLDAVIPLCKEVIFTSYSGGRALDPPLLKERASGKGAVASSPQEAIFMAGKAAGEEGLILVTGSFYLAGEVKGGQRA